VNPVLVFVIILQALVTTKQLTPLPLEVSERKKVKAPGRSWAGTGDAQHVSSTSVFLMV